MGAQLLVGPTSPDGTRPAGLGVVHTVIPVKGASMRRSKSAALIEEAIEQAKVSLGEKATALGARHVANMRIEVVPQGDIYVYVVAYGDAVRA